MKSIKKNPKDAGISNPGVYYSYSLAAPGGDCHFAKPQESEFELMLN